MDNLEQQAGFNKRTIHRNNPRPKVVTLIALSQFVKAGLLLSVVMLIWQNPYKKIGSLAFWEFFYAATNGSGKPDLVTPIIAVYSLVIGWGLLYLKRWARNVLIFTTGITVFLWLRYLIFDSFFIGTPFNGLAKLSGFQRESILALILVDSMIFCCLTLYPDVAEAFNKNGFDTD